MLDRSPPDWVKEKIEDGQRLRGWITNSYAQVEFLLGDLIIRCRQFPEYSKHTASIPYGGADRAKKVAAILRNSGPLDLFADELSNLLIAFETQHETRNLLAHGFAHFVRNAADECWFDFRKLHRSKERSDGLIIRHFTLDEMESEKAETVKIAQTALILFRDIHSYFRWNE